MTKIPGFVFIGLGLLVSITSYFIDYQKMILFFYAGLVLIAIGVFRLGVNFITKEKPRKSIRQISEEKQKQSAAARQRFKQAAQRTCPTCGAVQHPMFVFCPKCGTKVR